MLKHDKILLFDFETTGLDARFEEIIEVGAVLLKRVDGQYKVVDELSLLVQPHKRLPDKIVEITHITDEMLLREGVTQEEAFQRFFEMYKDEHTLLVAYNILFDLSFMIEWMKKYHNRHFILKNDILDVMAIYKDRHLFPHRLEAAVKTYMILEPNTHRALDDIKATLEVLKKMALEKDNVEKYVNVIGYNPKYRVTLQIPYVTYVAQRGGQLEIEKS